MRCSSVDLAGHDLVADHLAAIVDRGVVEHMHIVRVAIHFEHRDVALARIGECQISVLFPNVGHLEGRAIHMADVERDIGELGGHARGARHHTLRDLA